MKAHQLIAAMAAQRGLGSLGLAKAVRKRTSQSLIYRYLHGQVASLNAPLAMALAQFFGLPLEAVYDDAVATKIARERGIVALPEREPKKRRSSEDAALDAMIVQQLAELPTLEMRRRAANLFVLIVQAVAAGREDELLRPHSKQQMKPIALPRPVR